VVDDWDLTVVRLSVVGANEEIEHLEYWREKTKKAVCVLIHSTLEIRVSAVYLFLNKSISLLLSLVLTLL